MYIEREREKDLNGAVKDTAEANTVLEDLIDVNNGVVGFVGSTIGYIVDMQFHHLRHLLLPQINGRKLLTPF